MKNKVILLIILISILVLAVATLKGISLGGFSILSIKELSQKNEELNNRINEASVLTSKDYPAEIDELEETYSKYEITKEKYEELLGIVEEDNDEFFETKQYDIVYLWKTFGKYAKTRNLGIGMDVKKNNTQQDSFDLNFKISGQYVNISQFIVDIENNSDLNFRIYDFKMVGNDASAEATFKVKNINIDSSTLSNSGTYIDNLS